MLVRQTFPKSLTGAAEKDLIAVAFIAAFAGILIVERIIVCILWCERDYGSRCRLDIFEIVTESYCNKQNMAKDIEIDADPTRDLSLTPPTAHSKKKNPLFYGYVRLYGPLSAFVEVRSQSAFVEVRRVHTLMVFPASYFNLSLQVFTSKHLPMISHVAPSICKIPKN